MPRRPTSTGPGSRTAGSVLSARLGRRSFLGGVAAAGVGVAGLAAGCTSPDAASTTGSNSKKLSILLLGASQDLIAYMNKTALPAFKKSKGYSVELHSSDWGPGFQKVTTEAASNSLDDVVLIGGIWTAPLAAKGVLLDLTARMAKWSDASQLYPGMVADGQWQKKQYAIPYGGDIRSGVYRQDLLEAAGVSSLPTTWDEFKSAAEKVKRAGKVKAPIDWGIDEAVGLQQAFAQLFLEAGGTYWDANGKAQFDSDAGTKALTFLVDTYQQGLADYNMVNTGSGPSSLVRGASAMTYGGVSQTINAAQFNKAVVSKLVAGPALKMDASTPSKPVAWINKFAISAHSKDPDGAWDLITYLMSRDVLSKFDDLNSSLPARKDLAGEAWLGTMGKQILTTASAAITQPPNPKMLQVGPDMTTLLQKAIRGGASVASTLSAIDQKVDSING